MGRQVRSYEEQWAIEGRFFDADGDLKRRIATLDARNGVVIERYELRMIEQDMTGQAVSWEATINYQAPDREEDQ